MAVRGRVLCNVADLPIAWLWRGFVPMGALTLLEGSPGCLKSTVAYDLAARLTTGRLGPSEREAEGIDPAGVLIIQGEEPDNVVRGKLRAACANLDRTVIVDGAPSGGYDSIDRLRQYQRGVLSSTGGLGNKGGGSITTPISLPNTNKQRNYDLDALGNWKKTTFTPVGGSQTTENRQHNYLNQITKFNGTSVEYDHGNNAGSPDPDVQRRGNGNVADDGTRLYTWDALNRLTTVKRKTDSATIAQYTYDARNRRIRKVVSNGGLSGTIPNGTTDFLYNSGWQCLEERNGSNAPTKQYVWGMYIDELIQQRNDPAGTPADRYMLSDLLYRGTALTDDSGDIVEAYDTDAYGNTLIFSAAGTGGDWWADDATQAEDAECESIFTGMRIDAETGIYQYRNRYFEPHWGRFIARDPIGEIAGPNFYQYVDANPNVFLDPFGYQKGNQDTFGALITGNFGIDRDLQIRPIRPGRFVRRNEACVCEDGLDRFWMVDTGWKSLAKGAPPQRRNEFIFTMKEGYDRRECCIVQFTKGTIKDRITGAFESVHILGELVDANFPNWVIDSSQKNPLFGLKGEGEGREYLRRAIMTPAGKVERFPNGDVKFQYYTSDAPLTKWNTIFSIDFRTCIFNCGEVPGDGTSTSAEGLMSKAIQCIDWDMKFTFHTDVITPHYLLR